MIPDGAFIAGLSVVAIAGFVYGGMAGWQSRGQSDKEAEQPVSSVTGYTITNATKDTVYINPGSGTCGNGTTSWTCNPTPGPLGGTPIPGTEYVEGGGAGGPARISSDDPGVLAYGQISDSRGFYQDRRAIEIDTKGRVICSPETTK